MYDRGCLCECMFLRHASVKTAKSGINIRMRFIFRAHALKTHNLDAERILTRSILYFRIFYGRF